MLCCTDSSHISVCKNANAVVVYLKYELVFFERTIEYEYLDYKLTLDNLPQSDEITADRVDR